LAETFSRHSFDGRRPYRAYLDLEDGPPFVSPRSDYVAAWVAAVQAAGFQAGISWAASGPSRVPCAAVT
jgi:hypothetical protein